MNLYVAQVLYKTEMLNSLRYRCFIKTGLGFESQLLHQTVNSSGYFRYKFDLKFM